MGTMNVSGMCGSQIRAAKRSFDPKVYSRRAADDVISSTTDLSLIRRFESHPNKHVIRHAKHRADRLERGELTIETVEQVESVVLAEQANLQEAMAQVVREVVDAIPAPIVTEPAIYEAPAKSEFDLLVERFTAEGRKDPARSARASLAAKAGAAKRKIAN